VDARCSTVPSAAVSAGAIFLPSEGLTRLDLQDGEPPVSRWASNRLGPGSASPIVYEGRIYTLTRGGILKCGDAATGEEIWDPVRLGGTHWATPVIAGDYLYCINYDGQTKVVALGGEQGKVVATNEFGESIQGSPAVAGNALFVRSDAHLWKIAAD
jgi:outer membrane protein assembly factor BamB